MVRTVLSSLLCRVRGRVSLQLLTVAVVTLLLLGGLAGVFVVQTGSALGESTEQSMERTATLQAGALEQWVDHSRSVALETARADAVRDGSAAASSDELADRLQRSPTGVVALHVVDADGEVVASSEADRTGTSYAGTPVAGAVGSATGEAAGEPVLGPTAAYDDPLTGERAVGFVAPIDGEDGSAVVLVADLDRASAVVDSPHLAASAHADVVDQCGTVLLSDDSSRVAASRADADDACDAAGSAVQRAGDGSSGALETTVDGETAAVGYAPVSGTDWVVRTHVPAADAYALQSTVTPASALLIAALLAAICVVGVSVGRHTTAPIRELAAAAREIESGNLDVEIESDRSDEIGQLYDAFDGMRMSVKHSIEQAQTARREADQQEAARAELADLLEERADEFAAVTSAAADGDLSARLDEDCEHATVRRIATEYNDLAGSIGETLADIRSFSDEVLAHSEAVTGSVEEVTAASEDVSVSVTEIADRTATQHELFDSVSERVEDLTGTTEEIAARCDEVATLAERTAETGADGRVAASETIDALDTIDEEAGTAVDEIADLQAQMRQVEEKAERITELADRTNVLAVNANIEASRSAEQSGFEVVAAEVKELSAEAKATAEEIESVVDEARTQTERTACQVESTRERVADEADTIRTAADALEDVADFADETAAGIDEISTATEEQASTTQAVLATVEEAAALSEGVEADASSVAAAAQEQTSALTEVTDGATDLAERARTLHRRLEQYELASADVDGQQATVADD